MRNSFFKIIAIVVFGIIALSNALVITNNLSTGSINLDLIIKQALADGESGGGDNKHSQVVGCGSKSMEDWVAGCCAGTGGCTDNCNKTPEYCD